jgi:branched-subunit amino acid transport protein
LTFFIRASFIMLWGKIQIPEFLYKSLRFIPPAVLSAIIFPELLARNGDIYISANNTRLIAGIIAILVAWKTRNSLVTILVGMIVLFVLQFLVK